MQVGESETVGIVDDDGIGVGDVYSVLNYRRRKQYIVIIVHESHHDFLQFLGFHLSMSDGDTAVGNVLPDEICDFLQVADTVVDKVDLPVAAHFEVDGIGNHFMREGGDLGLDGITVGRRCAHDTHVACAHQRELERPWNRGS